jgi:hypothetical protein
MYKDDSFLEQYVYVDKVCIVVLVLFCWLIHCVWGYRDNWLL